MRFMCGHRLQGRTNSTSGYRAATLSLIEHSVTRATRAGRFSPTKSTIPAVDPAKSAAATTSGGASGWASTTTSGIALAHLTDVLGGEALVHLAVAGPGDDLNIGHLGGRVLRQELVRQHDHPVDAERLDDLLGIARGAADVRLRLHGRGRVDIGDDRHARVARPQLAHILCRDRLGQGAAGLGIRDEHRLARIEEFGGLGHEVHAGEHDHVGIGVHRLTRQRQAVADDVGHRVEDLRRLVVVGQDDRVVLRA